MALRQEQHNNKRLQMKRTSFNLLAYFALILFALGCVKEEDPIKVSILSPPKVDINFIGHNTAWNFNAQINMNLNIEEGADFLYNYTVRVDNLSQGIAKNMNNYYGETDDDLYAGNQFTGGSSSGSHTCQFLANIASGDTVVVSIEGECRVNENYDIGFAESEFFILP